MEEKIIKIAKEVFDAFLESETREDFNKKLKELSLKYHKTGSFLRQIKDDYYFDVASFEERNLYMSSKARLIEGGAKYKNVIDKLLFITDDERIKFIEDNNIHRSDFNSYFNNYFKRYNNEDVYKLREWVDNYYDDKEKNQYMDRKKLAYVYLEELVGNGYYNVGDYVNDFYSKYSIDKVSFNEEVRTLFDSIRSNYHEMYVFYKEKMKINRIIRFNTLKPKIDDFISNIDNYDIVDYFLMFKISVKDFCRLCKGLIDEKDVPKFSKFFGKYLEIEESVISDEQVINSNYSFNGVVPTLIDKENTLSFMKENNIPNVYFSLALKKYVNGFFNNKKLN